MPDVPTMASPDVAMQVEALTKRLTPMNARIDYVTDLLKPMLAVGEPEDRNAFYAASRLLGCTPAFARTIVGAVARRGSAKAWRRWRARPPALPVFEVPPLPANVVGLIYFAKPVSETDVVKIGISTNLERHLRDLEAETGEPHVIDRWFVGTTVDEAVAQFALSGRRISGKWFLSGEGRQIPGFIPMGLAGMRRSLGADLLKRRAA